MNRKTLYLAVILCASMLFTGCSAAWVSTIDTILAAAAPAPINILQIIAIAESKPFHAELATKINSDAATIKQLAGDFASASVASAPGVCQQLNAAVGVYTQDQQAVLALAQVSDSATQQKIAVLAGLVTSTIGAITAVLPQCQNPSGKMATPPLNVRKFVSGYNAALTAKTGNAAVDALTPKLKIHEHSAFVRYATLGILK
jgi:hypothetical protein